MRNLIKNKILSLLLFFIIELSYNNIYSQTSHVFGLTEYYYLQLKNSMNYEMKIGMYGEKKVIGTYDTNKDTLTLETFKFIDKNEYLTDIDKNAVKYSYNRYLIMDSLLIPLKLLELNIPRPSYIEKDTTNSDWYILSDGHVTYRMKLRNDSIFNYQTGSDISRNNINGKWTRKDSVLYLFPDTNKHIEVLGLICSDLKMLFYNKFLIGKTLNKDKYIYLIKR